MTVTSYPNLVAGERVEGARHAIELFTTTKTAYAISRERWPAQCRPREGGSCRPSR